VPKDAKSALESWKEADASARHAENLLKVAWAEYEARQIASIPQILVKTVAQLRKEANEKLSEALELMKPEHPGKR
jgi:DNA-directed RNA polymerase specialized sigma24 family protein